MIAPADSYSEMLDVFNAMEIHGDPNENIDYGNFKNSVPWEDELRHDVYFNVWNELSKLQHN